ncbi:hypothetical protein KI387_027485, partial [Taxus chinensis]
TILDVIRGLGWKGDSSGERRVGSGVGSGEKGRVMRIIVDKDVRRTRVQIEGSELGSRCDFSLLAKK